MADYPLPKFHFTASWEKFKVEIGFTEVSGLDFETEVIEFRHGASNLYNKTKQPGLTKYSNVTLKRGVFKGKNEFFDWWKTTAMFEEGNSTGSLYRDTVTIQMLDENHAAVMTWQLTNAWPTKVQSTDLKADGNEVAIETMELCHEGLTVQFEGS